MKIITDIPEYLLVDTFKKGIEVSEIIYFPFDCNNLNIKNDELLIIIGELFYKEITENSNFNTFKSSTNKIFNILNKLIINLEVENKIFISLIPTHFLFSDKTSFSYLKKESIDFLIQKLNIEIIETFSSMKNIFFCKV